MMALFIYFIYDSNFANSYYSEPVTFCVYKLKLVVLKVVIIIVTMVPLKTMSHLLAFD